MRNNRAGKLPRGPPSHRKEVLRCKSGAAAGCVRDGVLSHFARWPASKACEEVEGAESGEGGGVVNCRGGYEGCGVGF